MKGILRAIGPCLVLPPFLFVMLHYPVVEDEVCQRAPLIVAHDLARQLEAQTAYVESLNKDLPAPYRCILADYKRLLSAEEFVGLRELSTPKQSFSLAEKALAAFILWRRNLPQDFLTADPVGETMDRITAIGMKEERSELRRADIVFRHVLDCLKQTPPPSVPSAGTRNRLPPDIEKNGLLFCGDRVPLDREDVRRRIESQVDYLLNDMRETLAVWLKRKDRYGKAVEMILVQEGVPAEFAILPALESGYDGSAASPSMAGGWWQFLKPTAVRSRSGDRELDWSLQVNQLKDERRDLVVSTRSAARYLRWIRSRLSNGGKPAGWLITAAAYNAGLTECAFRMAAYNTDSFWDMKLPRETEDYVPRWLALVLIDSHRELYSMDVPRIAALDFDTLEGVRLNKDLPATVLATVSSSSVRFIREINGTLRNETSSFKAKIDNTDATHTIHVPRGCKDLVRDTLKSQGYLKDGS